jgi:cytochrome c
MGAAVTTQGVLQGDPEDRKAVLAHKQWVQEEEERLGKLRQDWVRRRDQKRKAADRKRHIKKQKVGH